MGILNYWSWLSEYLQLMRLRSQSLYLIHNVSYSYISNSDKGKPAESLGRKTMGLMRLFVMTARLPELIYKVQNWVNFIAACFVLDGTIQIRSNLTQ